MSPSFIRDSRGIIGVVLVKYKGIKLPTEINKDAEIVSEVRLVVKLKDELQIHHETYAKMLKISDLTEKERLRVKKEYNLDEKFYPTKSDINEGIARSIEKIKICQFICINSTLMRGNNLKWPELEAHKKIHEFIKTLDVNKLILDVNKESATRE